jgi:hypothetical protein
MRVNLTHVDIILAVGEFYVLFLLEGHFPRFIEVPSLICGHGHPLGTSFEDLCVEI